MESEIITARVRPVGTKKKLKTLAKKLGYESLNQYLENLLTSQINKK